MKFVNQTVEQVIELIKGKNVKIVSNLSGHGYQIGSVIDVKTAVKYNGISNALSINGCGYLYTNEIELENSTLESLKENLKYIEAEKEKVQAKIEYLEMSKQEIFNENEFKVYNALKILEGTKSELEKAKIIAKLINS